MKKKLAFGNENNHTENQLLKMFEYTRPKKKQQQKKKPKTRSILLHCTRLVGYYVTLVKHQKLKNNSCKRI